MNLLISKIQHKNFEIGEFVQEKERSFEESINLIEHFPWEEERGRIVISLTNPSVTFQGKNNDYLKLALYYNGKYVLHYFDAKHSLFTKSFTRMSDAYQYIESFFSLPGFDLRDFRKEITLFQRNLKHFVSQEFCYEVTPKVIRRFLFYTSSINLGLGIFFIILFIVKSNFPNQPLAIAILLFTIILMGGGLNLILFFNYYLYARNKILKMSKGNDIFYFGTKENPVKYDKKDIIRLVRTNVENSKNPVSGFAVVMIELNNGEDLKIPNLLIDHLALEHKLDGIPKALKNGFPVVRS